MCGRALRGGWAPLGEMGRLVKEQFDGPWVSPVRPEVPERQSVRHEGLEAGQSPGLDAGTWERRHAGAVESHLGRDVGPSPPGAESCVHPGGTSRTTASGTLKGPLWSTALPELPAATTLSGPVLRGMAPRKLEKVSGANGHPSESLTSGLNPLFSVCQWANDLASLSPVP